MSEDRGDTDEQRTPQAQPSEPSTSVPSGSGGTGEQKTWRARLANQSTPTTSDEGVVWVRIAPSQVVRTVAVALLTAAVVLGALFLLWQVRTIIGWGILALFLAAVLNPAVNWLQRRGIGRSIGILLTYLGVVLALLFGGHLRARGGRRDPGPDRLHRRRGSEPGRGNRVPQDPLGTVQARILI
jgi:hypothetical protein